MTVSASQSMAKHATSKPSGLRACQLVSGSTGPTSVYGMREAAGHQVFGIEIARIQEVFTREQALGREMGMHDGRELDVCGRGRGRFDIGDEMGTLLITGLRQVDLYTPSSVSPASSRRGRPHHRGSR